MRAALFALVSTAVFIPSAAFAQQTCEQRSNQVLGTVLGGAAGAALGGAVAGKDDRGTGAAIGAIGGAILGSQLGKPKQSNCNEAYGFYDNQGAWHTNAVERNRAQGYYDREGRWVSGAPNGYYDTRGAWVQADARARPGYYDDRDRWVPPEVNGYYDTDNRWTAVSNDRRGDWNDRGWNDRNNTGWNDRDWNDRPNDLRERADWLRQRIIRAENERRISSREARSFLVDLNEITKKMNRRNGRLNRNDQQVVEAQLNNLSNDFRREMRG